MQSAWPFAFACLLLLAATCSRPVWAGPREADLFVAADGSDDWSGTIAAPNNGRSDGPFATLGRAQAAARELRRQQPDRPVTVAIRGGQYTLDAPIIFTPEDSGTEAAPTTYCAYGDERPTFTGGSVITGWRRAEGDLWQAEVPAVKAGEWYFHQLWVGGTRAVRARHPNQGYLRIADTLKPLTDRTAARGDASYKVGFKYTPGDIPHCENLDDLQVVNYHSWTASLHWVKQLDEAEHAVHFTNQSAWPIGYWEAKERYHLENYFEALDAPGEWYLNRTTGVLSYWPREGEDMTRVEVVAPRLQHLVLFDSDPAAGKAIDYVTLRGLRFTHSEWLHEKEKMADGQAAVHLSAAIVATGARNCLIEDCEIAHIGEYAVILAGGCKHNTIRTCHIHDLGGGGVRLGETVLPAEPELQAEYNTVDNCFIHDGGHVFPAGIGVWIGRSSYNTVSHNEICDFFYSGCSVGWSWGYAPSSAHHNIFEYNHIHNLGKGVLSDMGGIYSLGRSPGTVERYNLIHDVESYSYGGWGLYTDEGSSDIVLENNICYNCKTGGFHQHYGRMNIVRNNIFAFSKTGVIQRSRQEPHISFLFKRNIILTHHGEPLGGNWGDGNYRLDRNIYFDIADTELSFDGYDADEWREMGRDRHSRIVDPGFVDARNYDFRLRDRAAAIRLGFDPIDTSAIGLYGDPKWVALPRSIAREPSPLPDVAPRQPFRDDFEDMQVGEKASLGSCNEEGAATIRVTDEVARSGRHSLKFTDAPGLTHDWQPHLSANPVFTRGTATMSFDILLREGAVFWHEWRDTKSPYRVGPSMRITAAGDVVIGGQTLTTVPRDEWVHVEMSAPLGSQAGEWTLRVRVGEGKTQTFEGLKIGTDGWRQIRWIVFVSLATEATVFYMDNISLDAG